MCILNLFFLHNIFGNTPSNWYSEIPFFSPLLIFIFFYCEYFVQLFPTSLSNMQLDCSQGNGFGWNFGYLVKWLYGQFFPVKSMKEKIVWKYLGSSLNQDRLVLIGQTKTKNRTYMISSYVEWIQPFSKWVLQVTAEYLFQLKKLPFQRPRNI